MKRLKKEKLSKKVFYPKYLKLVNVILPDPLTPKEIEVLSKFMELEGDLVEEDRFGTQARTVVRNKLGFKTNSNLDNYIKYFKKNFDLLNDFDIQRECFGIHNLRPMWWLDNAHKSAKLNYEPK